MKQTASAELDILKPIDTPITHLKNHEVQVPCDAKRKRLFLIHVKHIVLSQKTHEIEQAGK